MHRLYCCGLILLFVVFKTINAGTKEHVHLKIHIPEINLKHTHTKTKYIHLFHPKKHHSHVKFLHARTDPGYKYPINSGFQPIDLPLEYAIPNEYQTWPDIQTLNGFEQSMTPLIMDEPQLMGVSHNHNVKDEFEDEIEEDKENEDSEEDDDDDNDKYIPPSPSKRKPPKKPNRVENKKRETFSQSTRTGRHYPKFNPHLPHTNSNNKNNRPNNFGFVKPVFEDTTFQAQASKVQNQYFNMNPKSVDPGYYTTLPDDKEMEKLTGMEDDLYSGLLTNKFSKQVNEKAKIIKTMNTNRSKKMLPIIKN